MGQSNSVGDKFRQPVLHRNLSASFEDEDDDEHEDEGFMLIPSDQDA